MVNLNRKQLWPQSHSVPVWFTYHGDPMDQLICYFALHLDFTRNQGLLKQNIPYLTTPIEYTSILWIRAAMRLAQESKRFFWWRTFTPPKTTHSALSAGNSNELNFRTHRCNILMKTQLYIDPIYIGYQQFIFKYSRQYPWLQWPGNRINLWHTKC